MGWKLAVVVVPLEERALADVVSEIYQRRETLSRTEVDMLQALNPSRGQRYAIAHDRFAWICDWKVVERSFKSPLAVHTAHSFMLLSTVNSYGFATARDGKFLRNRQGEADNGITVDIGTPTECERALVSRDAKPGQEDAAWQAWTNAEKTFDTQHEITDAQGIRQTVIFDAITHDSIGESIVLGLMGELVGFRFDVDSPALEAFWAAPVMRLEPAKRSIFGWLAR